MFVLILISLCSSEAVCPDSTTITLDAEAIKGYTNPKYHDCNNLGAISFTFAQRVEAGKKVIPKKLFYNCKMTSITIGKEVTKIGEYAFSKCTTGTISFDTTAESNLNSIEQHAFEYLNDNSYSTISISLPKSLVTIGKYAFKSSYLSSISLVGTNLEPSLDTIDEYAFQYCSQLNSISSLINSATKLTKIGSYAFYQAGSSVISTFSLTIPHLLTKIESFSFSQTKISSISIDENHESKLQTIESSAFAFTHYLSSNVDLYKANKLTRIMSRAFYDSYSGELYYGYNSEDNKVKYTVIFPDSLQKIERQAFTFDSGFSYHKLVFPELNSATDFGENAFKGQSLAIRKSEYYQPEIDDENPLVFSGSLLTIGNSAFEGVQNQNFNIDLSQATKLTTIGDKAFYQCSLSDRSNLHINSEDITEIGENAFNLKYVEQVDNKGEYPGRFKVKLFFKNLNKITNLSNFFKEYHTLYWHKCF